MDVRRAVPGDAEGIVALINRVAAMEASLGIDAFPLPPEAEAAFIERSDPRVHLALVASEGGDVAGHLYASRGTTPYLQHVGSLAVVVAPEYRRRQIGSLLLQGAKAWAAAVEVQKLTLSVLSVNSPARRLFESQGFRAEAVRPGQFRIDGNFVDEVQMAIWLDGRILG